MEGETEFAAGMQCKEIQASTHPHANYIKYSQMGLFEAEKWGWRLKPLYTCNACQLHRSD